MVPEPKKFAAEMRHVTRPGGIVACGTFDFWGGFSAAEHIIEIGATLDNDMRAIRDYRRARRLFWPDGMARLWRNLGLTDVIEVPIVISFDFKSFDDYWTSLCTGPNSMAQRMNVMPSERRDDIHRLVMSSYLASMDDGPRSFASIVRSVQGCRAVMRLLDLGDLRVRQSSNTLTAGAVRRSNLFPSARTKLAWMVIQSQGMAIWSIRRADD